MPAPSKRQASVSAVQRRAEDLAFQRERHKKLRAENEQLRQTLHNYLLLVLPNADRRCVQQIIGCASFARASHRAMRYVRNEDAASSMASMLKCLEKLQSMMSKTPAIEELRQSFAKQLGQQWAYDSFHKDVSEALVAVANAPAFLSRKSGRKTAAFAWTTAREIAETLAQWGYPVTLDRKGPFVQCMDIVLRKVPLGITRASMVKELRRMSPQLLRKFGINPSAKI